MDVFSLGWEYRDIVSASKFENSKSMGYSNVTKFVIAKR